MGDAYMRTWTRIAVASLAALAPVLTLADPAAAALTTVADWQMESTQTMVDGSSGGNNGTPFGISATDGSTGSGYHFEGSLNSHVEVPDNGTLNPDLADYRVSLHVRFTAAPSAAVGDYDLIRKGLKTTSGGDWKIEILTSSTGAANPRCWWSDGTNAQSIRGNQDLADGAWHTITCVKTSSANSLIVDGATISATPKVPIGAITNTAPVVVGQKWGGGDQYTGDMDDITIQKGPAGTPTPNTPPSFTAGTPANNANSVALATNVTATFSEKVQGVGAGDFTVAPTAGGAAVAAAYTSNSAGTKWTLNPAVNLIKDTWYTVTLTGAITDVQGAPLNNSPVTWQFLTGPAPTVKSTGMSPLPGATGVPVTSPVSATFSERVQNVTTSTFTLTSAAGTVSATVNRSGTTNTWILKPDAPLAGGTAYTVTLVGGTSGITDMVGNPLKTVTWAFTTA